MAGPPGSGKSALAGPLARALGCALLAVDPIEAALWRAGIARDQPTGLAAYIVAEALAREQLHLGNDVIVDAVNDATAARQQWRSLAAQCASPLVFVVVSCSDERVHRQRFESRRRDIEGFPESAWEAVVERQAGFVGWSDEGVHIDSLRPLKEEIRTVLDHIERSRRASQALASMEAEAARH
ncbi:MAG: ATP-binding protein [Actinomycetota bacterium]|nr:ATP-binding protein [Actinomycetota bacterium]